MSTSVEHLAVFEPLRDFPAFPEAPAADHARFSAPAAFPPADNAFAPENPGMPPVEAGFSPVERVRPDLHGCILFDGTLRASYVSRPLRDALPTGDSSGAGEDVFALLAPLLDEGGTHAATPLRLWLEATVAGPADESTSPLQLTLHPDRSLEARLHRVGNGQWLLSLDELPAPRGNPRDAFAVLYQDRLTGAANRPLFEHKVDLALQRLNQASEGSVTVLFLDLDRFKAVNDTLGHTVGDTLLTRVTERLRAGLRETDTLARLGGDTFAILLRGVIEEQRITEIAARLIDAVRRPYLINGHAIHIGASIGAARAPEDGRSREQLLRSADLALFHSKSAGRGVFHFFAPAMQARAQERRALELDLRKALVMRQFEMHYQPQIDLERGAVTGLEASLRWRHPTRGLLPPAEFLGFAEEIGLAIPIGNWLLKTACKDAIAMPPSVTIALNVSAGHLESSDFSMSVAGALKAAGLPGSGLEIQVTEATLLRKGSDVSATLGELRSMGVRVAMNGFGTGLSSLSQIVEFPFDKIKIHRSLLDLTIGTTSGSAKSRAILRAICALGQSLGVVTLAEGVETPEHLAQARVEGCHAVQGSFYSKAVPAMEVAGVLASLQARFITP